jgi:carbamoyltransferase
MRARVGLGAVLNTSFNIHGEPLVCTPEDAIDVFLRSGADALCIGPYLVRRQRAACRTRDERAA